VDSAAAAGWGLWLGGVADSAVMDYGGGGGRAVTSRYAGQSVDRQSRLMGFAIAKSRKTRWTLPNRLAPATYFSRPSSSLISSRYVGA